MGSLRTTLQQAPILGLFCATQRTPGEVVHSLLNGLDDFLTCPFREIDLLPRIQRLLQRKRGEGVPTQQTAMAEQFRVDSLVGESECFLRVVEKIPLLAHTDATVLITGETGTGKELFARAIHYHGRRQGKPFIPVNCGALPDQLLENELFGHAKGAFTHAFSPQPGLVAEAEGGTLFLDEIETLSASAQTKLLRFLQDREYRPLGSPKSKVADVRIIAATNADLRQLIIEKHFREDLYYRLHVLTLSVPPLRERLDDIPLLAAHFASRYGRQQGRGTLRLSSSALQKLLAYPWPGNVRELEGVIQQAMILNPAQTLRPEDINLPIPSRREGADGGTLREAKASAVRAFERAYLTKLLTAAHGNITRAAEAAGKERRTFQRLLQKYGLVGHAFKNLV